MGESQLYELRTFEYLKDVENCKKDVKSFRDI
jgi:hypothetical protein